ncbi:MAG: SCO family protein [Deltaproteobacteria bacterium]
MILCWNASRIAAGFLLIGMAGSPAFAHLPLPPKQGEIGRKAVHQNVPNFTLIDQDGKRFQFANARGKPVVVTFIFTTCPDVCPLLTAKFAAMQRELAAKKRDDYLLLSITTDPQTDTSAVLKSYAKRYKPDFRHWLFLTGSREQLAKVWKEFGVTVQSAGPGQIQHTTLTTLIDRDGVRRFDYYTDRWQEKEILRDIDSLDSVTSK